MKPLFMKSKKELKKKLHELIDSIDDEHVLSMLNEDIAPYAVKNRAKDANADDDLTEDQLEQLDRAIEEADRGETSSAEEFKRVMSRWLTK